MSSLGLKTLYVKYLRGESTPEEAEQVQQLRSIHKNETEIKQIQNTLDILTQLQQEKIKEPSTQTADSIMRKVRITGAGSPLYSWFAWRATALAAVITCLFVVLPFTKEDLTSRNSNVDATQPGSSSTAQSLEPYSATTNPEFNDDRITNSFDRVLTFLEGSFGALAMVLFGLLSLISALLAGVHRNRKYLTSAGIFLILTILVFILRSFISTFFNTAGSILIP